MGSIFNILLNNVVSGPCTDPFPFGETYSPKTIRGRGRIDPSAWAAACAAIRAWLEPSIFRSTRARVGPSRYGRIPAVSVPHASLTAPCMLSPSNLTGIPPTSRKTSSSALSSTPSNSSPVPAAALRPESCLWKEQRSFTDTTPMSIPSRFVTSARAADRFWTRRRTVSALCPLQRPPSRPRLTRPPLRSN